MTRLALFSRFSMTTWLAASLLLVSIAPTTFSKETAKEAEVNATTAVQESPAAKKTSKAKPTSEKGDKQVKKVEKKAKSKVRFAQIVLTSSLAESPGSSSPFGDTQLDLQSTIKRIEKAAKDDSIDGLILMIRSPAIGRGKVHELRDAIARYRKSGKKVYADIESAMPSDYLIASACDEIVMPESGMVILPGVRIETMFYKGLLDKLGVHADFLHMGDAKGAAEAITRHDFSKPVRENLTSMVDDLYEQMVETVAFDRPLTREQVIAAIDEGLMGAKRAKKLGFIDQIAYAEDLRKTLSRAHKTNHLVYVENYGKKKVDTDFSGPAGLFKLMKLVTGGSKKSGTKGKKIAVVYAVGAITSGKSRQSLLGAKSMGSDTIVKALREAAADDDIAAIVLRINSPGGSALASDVMWSQIEAIDKPIIASMGDVAASGGYYIAMGTDKIFAEPATITGSIGVVGGKMAMQGLYDKLGVTIGTIGRGKNSGVFSGAHPFSDTERKVILASMQQTYAQFTSKAATGRNMPVEQLRRLAGGRVYTGQQAKANGLVDEIGSLHDALAAAKVMAGMKADDEVKIKAYPEPVDFFESLFGNKDEEKEVAIRLDLGILSPELKAIAGRVNMLQRVFRDPVVLMMPFELEIK